MPSLLTTLIKHTYPAKTTMSLSVWVYINRVNRNVYAINSNNRATAHALAMLFTDC